MYNSSMKTIRYLEKQELLAISLHRLYLSQKTSMSDAVISCMGLQAQFSANPYYSLKLRSHDYDEAKIMQDYVKTWSFRGTMHLIHKEDLALHLSARGLHSWNDRWNMKADDKPYWSDFIINEIDAGNNTRKGLKQACLNHNISDEHFTAIFHGWGGMLQDMCLQGLIAYDASSKKRFVGLEPMTRIDLDQARAEMIRRYFNNYGPATLKDCANFTNYRIKEILSLIENFNIELNEIITDDKHYYYLGELPQDCVVPELILLSGFDALLLGYYDKSRFMNPSEKAKYVTNTGIIFPGILVKGRLAARWQKGSRTVIVKPYRKLLVKEQKEITRQLRHLFPEIPVQFEDILV